MRSLTGITVRGVVTALAVIVSGASEIRTLWHVEGQAWGTPATDGETVYFLSRRHEVVALDAASGTQRWRVHTGESGPTTTGSTIVVAGDQVIAGDYNLVAFDRRDGALRWRFTPDDGYAPGVYLGGVVGDLVYAGSPAGRVYAIDHRTGHARWSTLVADDGETTVFQPEVDGDALAIGYTTFSTPNAGGVVVLDATTGRERWRAPFPRDGDATRDVGWAGGPVFTEEVIVAVSAEGIGYAFDRANGSLRWTLPKWTRGRVNPVVAPQDRDFRPLARVDRMVLVGSLSGDVIAYDLSDRTERWRYSSAQNGSVSFRIAADERLVYVPYVDGNLVVIDASSGRERWRTGDRLAGFTWPPAISGDRVFASDFINGFFAFRR